MIWKSTAALFDLTRWFEPWIGLDALFIVNEEKDQRLELRAALVIYNDINSFRPLFLHYLEPAEGGGILYFLCKTLSVPLNLECPLDAVFYLSWYPFSEEWCGASMICGKPGLQET